MFNLNFRVELVRLNLPEYRSALNDILTITLTSAARAYITTAIRIIPVWSGASQATFSALAAAVSEPLVISPVAASRVQLGVASSSGVLQISNARGSFTYETSLPHLLFNELNNANVIANFNLTNPGPYNFVRQAESAAQAVLDDFEPPDPRRFMASQVLTGTISSS